MEKLLKLEVIDNWMNEAEGLGFVEQRCDEFAEYIMSLYAGSDVEPIAEFIAHFIWEKGDKKLKPWESYAIWHTLEAEEERIAGLVNSEAELAAQEAYNGAWQEAYNHGLEEGYANGFYDGEHSERE